MRGTFQRQHEKVDVGPLEKMEKMDVRRVPVSGMANPHFMSSSVVL